MKTLGPIVFTVAMVAACGTSPVVIAPRDRPTTEDVPWVLSVQFEQPDGRTFHECSAILVEPEKAVTAAHCVVSEPAGTPGPTCPVTGKTGSAALPASEPRLKVRGGTKDYRHGGQVADVASIIPHPDFDWHREPDKPTSDIAVLKLAHPLGDIAGIGLAEPDSIAPSQAVTMYGWDVDSSGCGEVHLMLQGVPAVVAPRSVCNGLDATTGNLCLTSGRDVLCIGASGGPAIRYGKDGPRLAGVFSRVTPSTAGCSSPSVYTDVATFRDFIASPTR